MLFTISLETEDNEIVEKIIDKGLLQSYIPSVTNKDFYCLKYLDPYGDTVFNRLQMEDLICELSIINKQSDSEKFSTLINSIIKLAEKCKSDVHLYLKFCGD